MSKETKKYSFPKEKRICSNKQFRQILSSGKCFRNEMLTVYIAPNGRVASSKLKALGMVNVRLGISVGKSCGNAVERNRIKRLVREAFRLNQDKIPSGCDYLVLIKRKIDEPSFEQIKDSFLSLVLKNDLTF